MLRNCTKGTASKAAPVRCQRELYHFQGRDRFCIGGMGLASERQLVYMVHFSFCQKTHRPVLHDDSFRVRLDNTFSSNRVLFQEIFAKSLCKGCFILRNVGKGRNFDIILLKIRLLFHILRNCSLHIYAFLFILLLLSFSCLFLVLSLFSLFLSFSLSFFEFFPGFNFHLPDRARNVFYLPDTLPLPVSVLQFLQSEVLPCRRQRDLQAHQPELIA